MVPSFLNRLEIGVPRTTPEAVITTHFSAGMPSAAAYHFGAARHRTSRLNRAMMPWAPSAMPATINADTKGTNTSANGVVASPS